MVMHVRIRNLIHNLRIQIQNSIIIITIIIHNYAYNIYRISVYMCMHALMNELKKNYVHLRHLNVHSNMHVNTCFTSQCRT